jgi:hypothetical protein
MATWRIFYHDGTTFSSDNGDPVDAPSVGVVCIIQGNIMLGREILNRWDCYFWDGSRWRKSTFGGAFDALLSRQTVESFIEGSIIDNQDFRFIWETAFDDPDPEIPKKTARDGWESPYSKEPDYMLDRLTASGTR